MIAAGFADLATYCVEGSDKLAFLDEPRAAAALQTAALALVEFVEAVTGKRFEEVYQAA